MKDAKDAIIAEYTALRTEISQHVNTKEKTVLSWLLALTGGLFGTLLKVDIPGKKLTVISALSQNQIDNDAMMFLSVLMIGYVLVVELLVAYSLYQLLILFRMSDFILRLDRRIKIVLEFDKDFSLFAWDKESRGMADINEALDEIDPKVKKKVMRSLKIAGRFDLLTPATMTIIGFTVLLYLGYVSYQNDYCIVFRMLSISVILLGLGLVVLYDVYKNLHYLVIRTGSSPAHRLDEGKNNQDEMKS